MTRRTPTEHSIASRHQTGDPVIVLHGLLRSRWSMEPVRRRLLREGYEPIALTYPSRRQSPEQLVAFLHQRLQPIRERLAADAGRGRPRRLHFVTHSLGGILTRAYLEQHPLPADQQGRIVMLAPPNQGSEIVDRLGPLRLFGWVFGGTGQQLGTGQDSLPNRVGVPDAEIGVVAGERSVNPIGSWLLGGPGDGAVRVDRTRLPEPADRLSESAAAPASVRSHDALVGRQDWIALPANHTTIMWQRPVLEQTLHFLRYGSFERVEQPESDGQPG